MPGHEILSAEEIEADLLKTAEELSKEAAPWKNKLLAPALGLGMALTPNTAPAQPAAQTQQVKKPSVEKTVKYINGLLVNRQLTMNGNFLTYSMIENGKVVGQQSKIDLLEMEKAEPFSNGTVFLISNKDDHDYGFVVEGEADRVANAFNYLLKVVKEQAKKDPFANPPSEESSAKLPAESIVTVSQTSPRFSSYQQVKDQTADGAFRMGTEAKIVQYDSTGKWAFIVMLNAQGRTQEGSDYSPDRGWVAASAIAKMK